MMGRLLAHADHWAVIKATCSLLCNLALNSSNLTLFKEAGKHYMRNVGDLPLSQNHK